MRVYCQLGARLQRGVTCWFFGILMLLIRWLIFQRSAMTEPNMAVTFNVMILGVLCGYFGSRCLGGDGDVWLIYWRPFAASIYSETFDHLFYSLRSKL